MRPSASRRRSLAWLELERVRWSLMKNSRIFASMLASEKAPESERNAVEDGRTVDRVADLSLARVEIVPLSTGAPSAASRRRRRRSPARPRWPGAACTARAVLAADDGGAAFARAGTEVAFLYLREHGVEVLAVLVQLQVEEVAKRGLASTDQNARFFSAPLH